MKPDKSIYPVAGLDGQMVTIGAKRTFRAICRYINYSISPCKQCGNICFAYVLFAYGTCIIAIKLHYVNSSKKVGRFENENFFWLGANSATISAFSPLCCHY